MKLFVLLISLISFAVALPTSSWMASEISDDRPVLGRPISDRPLVDRPVEGRPLESRPIGSRGLEARQNVVAGEFIISFKEGYTHDAFKAFLKKEDVEYEFRYVYNSKVFLGVSIQLKNTGDLEKIKKWDGVKSIDPVHIIQLPKDPPYVAKPVPVEA